jgi:hypothetical protein
MSEPGPLDEPEPQDPHEPYHQQVQHQSVSARLPESLGGGVFCTSSLIVESGDMFLIDFVNGSAPPARLVARVVVTPTTMQQFLTALTQACEKSQKSRQAPAAPGGQDRPPGDQAGVAGVAGAVGTQTVSAAGGSAVQGPKAASGGSTSSPRSVEDIYAELKFTDDRLCGAFANTVIIRHSVDEVVFDFIANYFPRAVVTCRVGMATSRIERFRRSLEDAFRKYQEKKRGF